MKTLIKSLLPHGLVEWRQQKLASAYAPAPEALFSLPEIDIFAQISGLEQCEITFPMTEWTRTQSMVMPLTELLLLGALTRALQPQTIFEIGTFTGSSTLMMALNSPTACRLYTLDLPPGPDAPYSSDVVGRCFKGTPSALKVEQLFGHSSDFDYTPYRGQMDLVLVDADHAQESVWQDSQQALRLLRPGGMIIWDDYRWLPAHQECQGVTLALNKLSRTVPLYQVKGTRLAMHQSS